MIQKIYEVDPLTCPKCSGTMRILAFIEDQELIRKILSHLGLWKRTPRPPPPPHAPDVILDPSPLTGRMTSTRIRGSPSIGLHSTGGASLPGRGFVRPERPPDALPHARKR